METLGTYFDAIVAFTTWPFGATDWFGALLRSVTVILAYWMAWRILRWIYRKISRKVYVLRNRQRCTHCDKYTLKLSDGAGGLCVAGSPCCASCQFDHRFENEPIRFCTAGHGSAAMQKVSSQWLIQHECPQCGSVTMASSDFIALLQYWYQQGEDNAEPAIWSLLLGGVIGWNIGMGAGMAAGGD